MKILLVAIALIAGCKSRREQVFGESDVDTTKIKAKKYAYEAYTAWSASHVAGSCPEGLAALNEYMNGDDTNDSWGRPMKMFCGADVPIGAKGIAVLSFGPDGKPGTADDVKSWE